jgi:hypothetical protein
MEPLLHVLASGTGNAGEASGRPTEWFLSIPEDIVVTEDIWFSTGQLQLQLQVALVVTPSEDIVKKEASRFYNPTQTQLGHWAAFDSDFVISDGRIKYNKQLLSFNSNLIQVANTGVDSPRQYDSTSNTSITHSINTGEIVICGNVETAIIPEALVSIGYLSASVPRGTICMTTAPGRLQLYESEVFESSEPKNVAINLHDSGLPDRLSGVTWPGYALSWAWTIGHLAAVSSGRQKPTPSLLGGAPLISPAANVCVSGIPVPVPDSPLCSTILTSTVLLPDGSSRGRVECSSDDFM